MFEHVLEDIDKSDKMYSVINTDKVNNDNDVFLLGGHTWLKWASSSNKPCWVDDCVCTGPSTGSAFEFLDVTDTSKYAGIYGYIDFVSEEDNINFNNF